MNYFLIRHGDKSRHFKDIERQQAISEEQKLISCDICCVEMENRIKQREGIFLTWHYGGPNLTTSVFENIRRVAEKL